MYVNASRVPPARNLASDQPVSLGYKVDITCGERIGRVSSEWFSQLCGLVGAPSGYLRDLPAPLAGINLQHGLLSHRAELMKTLEAEDGRVELRAVGPDYGRIWDHEWSPP
jgi:hypothetical protein